ncbi:MAG: hypothetical protein L7F77_12400 [Candidatus Magnetominusculus sp. LBB02]|nr:hypothetical protein [Candidatus Magnetominusculus sp. LBB02]
MTYKGLVVSAAAAALLLSGGVPARASVPELMDAGLPNTALVHGATEVNNSSPVLLAKVHKSSAKGRVYRSRSTSRSSSSRRSAGSKRTGGRHNRHLSKVPTVTGTNAPSVPPLRSNKP